MKGGDEGFWADVPLGPGVTRVALDANGLAALNKPEGVLSHPNSPRDVPRSLLRADYDLEDECFAWASPGGRRRLWLLNRLDSATSGLILASTDGKLAAEVRAQFKRRQVRKTYQALVFGHPRLPSEAWRDSLEVRKHGGKIRTIARAGRIQAECLMTLVRAGTGTPRLSLLRLEPVTGRSHQLRVQAAKRGMPIVGDQTYGNFAANRAFAKSGHPKRLFLHSHRVTFEYTLAGQVQEFSAEAPLPPEFEAFA